MLAKPLIPASIKEHVGFPLQLNACNKESRRLRFRGRGQRVTVRRPA